MISKAPRPEPRDKLDQAVFDTKMFFEGITFREWTEFEYPIIPWELSNEADYLMEIRESTDNPQTDLQESAEVV